MSRSRVAVLAAAAALFTTAEAVQAAALDLELPLAPDQTEIGGAGAQVRTPVADVDADVQVSPGRVSAAVTTPPPSVEVPLPAPPTSPAEPPSHEASKGSGKEPKANRAPTSRRQHQVRPAVSAKAVAPDRPSMRTPAAHDQAGGLAPRSFLPETAVVTDESVIAAAAGSAGSTAALAGFVLVAIGLLSWTARQRPARLSPPLLSFALQRPG